MIQPDSKKFITDIDKTQNDMIILTLLGGHKISSSYIPPVDSSYFRDDMFSMVANQFEPESKDIIVLGGGDVNSRVANLVTPLRGGTSERIQTLKSIVMADFLLRFATVLNVTP